MFTLRQLQQIRRKVDRATKKADAAQEAAFTSDQTSPDSKHVLGYDWGSPILKGAYSTCYPTSVGATTQTEQLPRPVAVSAWDAKLLASSTGLSGDINRVPFARHQFPASHPATATT